MCALYVGPLAQASKALTWPAPFSCAPRSRRVAVTSSPSLALQRRTARLHARRESGAWHGGLEDRCVRAVRQGGDGCDRQVSGARAAASRLVWAPLTARRRRSFWEKAWTRPCSRSYAWCVLPHTARCRDAAKLNVPAAALGAQARESRRRPDCRCRCCGQGARARSEGAAAGACAGLCGGL